MRLSSLIRAPSLARAMALTPLAALALAGCISFGGKAPSMLLTLPSDAAPATNVDRTGNAASVLEVDLPNVSQKLRTPRVPVTSSSGALAYLKDAQWVEAPSHLFQHLLVDTLSARSNRLVLDDTQTISSPGETLSGELLDFGIDAGSGQAVVIYQALRVDAAGAHIAQRLVYGGYHRAVVATAHIAGDVRAVVG